MISPSTVFTRWSKGLVNPIIEFLLIDFVISVSIKFLACLCEISVDVPREFGYPQLERCDKLLLRNSHLAASDCLGFFCFHSARAVHQGLRIEVLNFPIELFQRSGRSVTDNMRIATSIASGIRLCTLQRAEEQ